MLSFRFYFSNKNVTSGQLYLTLKLCCDSLQYFIDLQKAPKYAFNHLLTERFSVGLDHWDIIAITIFLQIQIRVYRYYPQSIFREIKILYF